MTVTFNFPAKMVILILLVQIVLGVLGLTGTIGVLWALSPSLIWGGWILISSSFVLLFRS